MYALDIYIICPMHMLDVYLGNYFMANMLHCLFYNHLFYGQCNVLAIFVTKIAHRPFNGHLFVANVLCCLIYGH